MLDFIDLLSSYFKLEKFTIDTFVNLTVLQKILRKLPLYKFDTRYLLVRDIPCEAMESYLVSAFWILKRTLTPVKVVIDDSLSRRLSVEGWRCWLTLDIVKVNARFTKEQMLDDDFLTAYDATLGGYNIDECYGQHYDGDFWYFDNGRLTDATSFSISRYQSYRVRTGLEFLKFFKNIRIAHLSSTIFNPETKLEEYINVLEANKQQPSISINSFWLYPVADIKLLSQYHLKEVEARCITQRVLKCNRSRWQTKRDVNEFCRIMVEHHTQGAGVGEIILPNKQFDDNFKPRHLLRFKKAGIVVKRDCSWCFC